MTRRAIVRPCLCAGLASSVLALAPLPHAAAQCDAGWATHLPTARIDADMVYDSQRDRVVLFGGADGSLYRGDTWEFDGTSWRLAATTGPSPRRGHKMVYDPAHGRTLLVGGYAPGGTAAIQTWSWDGATWRMLDNTGPTYAFTTAAQAEHAAAFDQARGRLVLMLANGQVWEFSGVPGGWAQMSTGSAAPTARRGMALGYDRGHERIILFGGSVGSTRQADTWSWDGLQWVNMGTTGPSPRSEARIAYDSVNNRLTLYGGLSPTSTRLRDTWTLTDGVWTQMLSTGPSSVAGGAGNSLAFDAVRAQFLLAGGSVAPWTDVCTLPPGATAWKPTDFGPPARTGAGVAYDSFRQRAVVFGGLGSARFGDTWEFDGGAWRRVATTGPSARNECAMAYDPVRRRTVLFGGNTGAVNGETWEWDGASWALLSGSGPSARDRHAMAWDPNLGGVLLHGGAVSGGAANNETWLWNGASWSRVGTGPTRSSHAMAYFPPLDRIVLYGGSGAGVTQNAFAWDGSAWAQIGSTGPSPATEHSMVYDADSARLLLVGASTSDAAAWLFDGSSWQRVAHQAGTVRARTNQCLWHDPVRDRIMLYGGAVSGASSRETWEHRGIRGPVIASVPTWQVLCRSGEASFTVQLAAGSTAGSVAWLKNGAALARGETSWGSSVSTLISADGRSLTLHLAGLGDGDNGGYQCVVGNACGGATITNPAILRVCTADFNCSGTGGGDGVSTQDIFDYLTAWFAMDLRADINRDGRVSVQDLFDFISAYFAGC